LPFLDFFLFLEACPLGVTGTSFLTGAGSIFYTGLTSSSDAKASSKSAAI